LSRCVIAKLVPSGQKNEREKVVVAKGPRVIAIIMKRGSQIEENRTIRKQLEIIFSTTRLLSSANKNGAIFSDGALAKDPRSSKIVLEKWSKWEHALWYANPHP
jgi:hypothetical protein